MCKYRPFFPVSKLATFPVRTIERSRKVVALERGGFISACPPVNATSRGTLTSISGPLGSSNIRTAFCTYFVPQDLAVYSRLDITLLILRLTLGVHPLPVHTGELHVCILTFCGGVVYLLGL